MSFARCLIIETMDISNASLETIGKSLTETLQLSNRRVSDKQNLTHLTAYLIDTRVIPILPLRDIKSASFASDYLPKISNLSRYRYGHSMRSNGMANDGQQHIINNILSAIADVRQEARKLRDMKTFEMTYVSARDVESITEDLIHCFVGQRIDYSFLTQINILSLYSPNGMNGDHLAIGPVTITKYLPNAKDFQSLIEAQVIIDCEISIDAYFKVWLHENITSVRIRIHLDSESHKESKNTIIKCDLREAVIDVSRVPIGEFGQKVGSTPVQSFACINGTNRCHDFKAISVISREGLSDALIFGIPYILSATHSPDILYEELELNLSRFNGLCEVLNEKNAVILLESMRNQRQRSPRSFFVLVSSPDCKTLLMKGIASKELVLPHIKDSIDQMVPKESSIDTKQVTDCIRKSVNGLPLNSVFNPLSVKSNLFEYL